MVLDKTTLISNLRNVLQRINEIYIKGTTSNSTLEFSKINLASSIPRLVAVSKKFPAECIKILYNENQYHFGENYIQELIEKADKLKVDCPNIQWHFIGKLQSNKIRKLCEISGLWCIETIENKKHVDILQKCCEELKIKHLNVFIQVNTSKEKNKGGVEWDEAMDDNNCVLINLAKHIITNCKNLKLLGLMTIGSLQESSSSEKNQDFLVLLKARQTLCTALEISSIQSIELSMGMSLDFETAILYGSTNVRVGSSIFGLRN